MAGFELELLNRLPLAEAVWLLYRYVANDEVLNSIFERHRGRSYERTLYFSTLVALVHDALLVHALTRQIQQIALYARGDDVPGQFC